ncbi:MAG: hypothetical protein JSR21_11030 [Proteobacteria bacterium]|nr:hypothetical protein [Pseudomonadota bacterium]
MQAIATYRNAARDWRNLCQTHAANAANDSSADLHRRHRKAPGNRIPRRVAFSGRPASMPMMKAGRGAPIAFIAGTHRILADLHRPAAADPDQALRRFADRYGFDHGLLNGDDRYRIEGAGPGFKGEVARIRVTEHGRFGNIFLQLLHVAVIARAIGCREIEAFRFEGGPAQPRVEAGGLTFLFPPANAPIAPERPTLVGHFFNSYAFESILRALPSDAAWDLVQSAIRPLFEHIWKPAAAGPATLVVHFRAGDVFRDPHVSRWYVQPPASYYTKAIAHARETLGIEDVLLVYEDRGNPAIALVEDWLAREGIPFAIQSSDLATDAVCLASATHLVASVSTLTEAAAILSRTLRTFIAFRQAESHLDIHQRLEPLVAGVLRRKGVRVVVIADRDGDYIAPRSWTASPEQVRQVCAYPSSGLDIAEDGDAQDVPNDPCILRDRLAGAEQEAARLRRKLTATQERLARLEQSPRLRLFRRLHAFRRIVGLAWRVAPASD